MRAKARGDQPVEQELHAVVAGIDEPQALLRGSANW